MEETCVILNLLGFENAVLGAAFLLLQKGMGGMIENVILRDTKKEEWPEIRSRILNRILDNFGTMLWDRGETGFEELERYENFGLTHIKIKYEIMDGIPAWAIIVLPEDFDAAKQYPAVVTIHGTNGTYGKYGVLGATPKKNRAYAIELAKRGYVTISPDQFGFGEAMNDPAYKEMADKFYENYPDWSLTTVRLLGHMRCIDILLRLSYVKADGIGTMGNSLGGCAVMYLAAMDERISAAVMSTGISPWATNIYRSLNRERQLDPQHTDAMRQHGVSPWELNEMLSLCAPRAIMCLEPFNDPHNPDPMATIECVHRAWQVYNLLEQSQNLALYMHGDGHDTVDEVRDMAYDWFDRHLK